MSVLDFKYLGGAAGDRNLAEEYSNHLRYQLDRIEADNQAWMRQSQINAERKRKAEEATIELNQQTKVQNQLLRDEVKKLNEAITALKDGRERGKLSTHEFDVFISHANDNKAEFVNSLTDALNKLGITIWYDANTLEWGDDWKLQITNGLKKCRFGIVVISPEFLGREWTEKELNELLQRQNASGDKVVLPLLYRLTIDDLKKNYPKVADIQSITVTSETDVKDIAIDFARILIKSLR